MNPALRIMATLDRHLTSETHVVVFGSAALLLDQRHAGRLPGKITNDVDLIIPTENLLAAESDKQFWSAQEKTNQELEPEGLFLTHIFPEEEIVLTPAWKTRTIPLDQPTLSHLRLTRPSILDLIISKMGRGDAKDIEDVRTMLKLEFAPSYEIESAAGEAHVPDCYREIFQTAKRDILAVARKSEEALFEDATKELHRLKGEHPLASSPNNHPLIVAARHRSKADSKGARELLEALEALKSWSLNESIPG